MDNIDSYWSMHEDGGGGDGHLSGYSPAESASRPFAVARSNSNGFPPISGSSLHHLHQPHPHHHLDSNGSASNESSAAHAAAVSSSSYGLSPSALDPSSFSSQFILPRFASGGPGDAFGFGVAVAEAHNTNADYKSPGAYVRTPGLPTPNLYSNLYPTSATPFGGGGASQAFAPGVGASAYDDAATRGGSSGVSASTTTSNLSAVSALAGVSLAPSTTTSSMIGRNNSNNNTFTLDLSSSSSASQSRARSAQQFDSQQQQQQQPQSSVSTSTSIPPTHASDGGPVYAPYGSSIISVNSADPSGYKMPPQAVALPPSQAPAPGTSSYDPAALGLPVPPPDGTSNNFAGLYSSSGFDMLGVLARVAARPNPQLSIGAVDTSCAFLVVDAKRWDQPIVFASETFTKMTGYHNDEVIGKNCRFLQSPIGQQTQGSPRKYTDGNAAWHMRVHISAGKESQSSLINYKKDGKPFINLVTIIPIAWDSDEITYFVGFQVDLVDQPNAILDRMKDGTYVVNYSLYNNTGSLSMPSHPTTVSMASIEDKASSSTGEAAAPAGQTDDYDWTMGDETKPDMTGTESGAATRRGSVSATIAAAGATSSLAPAKGELETLDIVEREGVDGLTTEEDRRAFHKLLLSEADDYIHVLSLKGSFLYCSPSVASVLEYQPSELIGKTLPTLCHPSDVVPVMRLLKDTSTIQNPTVSLLYRIRRKHSGYIWLEASGKLHIEPGKGRKCVIFVGRPREVMKMSWSDLRQAGGVGETEFWMGLSPKGTILSTTSGVHSMLGHGAADLTGTSLLHLALPEHVTAIEQALRQCADGVASTVRYRFRNRQRTGYTDVVTRFYPRTVDELEEPIVASNFHCNILAQTNEVTSEQRKNVGPFANISPVYGPTIGAPELAPFSPSSDASSDGSGGAQPSFQSTFKTLAHPSTDSDNVFDELESRRPTSWQFELHQLQITNKKLRDEKDHLIGVARQRGFQFGQRPTPYTDAGSSPALSRRKGSSDGGSSKASAKSNGGRGCANCGRFDSPEWRAGPTGAKTLCNRCGLRYAKMQKQTVEGSTTGSMSMSLSSAKSDKSPGRRPSMSQHSSSSTPTTASPPMFTPYDSGSDAMQWQ